LFSPHTIGSEPVTVLVFDSEMDSANPMVSPFLTLVSIPSQPGPSGPSTDDMVRSVLLFEGLRSAARAMKGIKMADKKTVEDLLTNEIKDLYSAEKQLTKAIPKMAKGSNDEKLQTAFSAHLEETENQAQRLEQIAKILGISPTGKKCIGMEGCIKEGAEALEEKGDERILDLGLIGAGARVEHYEMAGYTMAISLAEQLGKGEVVALLKSSLAEEQAADQKLRTIGSGILRGVTGVARNHA
jgi:ferritin-like metal-binding protein YciE